MMAWEEPSRSLFTMVKPERPLIAIDRIPASTTHFDPLRTPEDVPQHAPLYTAHDHLYHFTPFDHSHATGFPDVEDTDWAMGTLSPPSPSRRNSLELEPFPGHLYDDTDMDEEPPTLSPPSPSRRSMALLPEADQDGSTFDHVDCPQLSPPSPIHRSTTLPSLEPELDVTQGLFIEDHPQSHSPRLLDDTHSLFLDDPLPYTGVPFAPPASRLQTEYRALLSLHERTMCTEHTSRARTIALRGRERELGRAVAKLRNGYPDFHNPAQPNISACSPSSISSVVSSNSNNIPSSTPDAAIPSYSDAVNTPSSLSTQSLPPMPMPPSTLQAYRTLATRVMLERTDEKRRRKKDKQRLKELRVVLGVGVEALLGSEGAGYVVDAGMNTEFCSAEKMASNGPSLGLEESSDLGVTLDLGIAYLPPGALRVAPPACEGRLLPDPHLDSNPGLGLGWVPAPAFGGLDGEFASCARGAPDPSLGLGLSAKMPPDGRGISLDSGVFPTGASSLLRPVSGSSLEPSHDIQPSLVSSSLGLGLVLPYEQMSNLGLDLGIAVRPDALAEAAKEHSFLDCAAHVQDRAFAFAHLSDTPPSSSASPISVAGGLSERTHAMRRLVARMTMRRRDLCRRSLIEAGNMGGLEGAGLALGGAKDAMPHRGKGRSRLSNVVFVADEANEKGKEEEEAER